MLPIQLLAECTSIPDFEDWLEQYEYCVARNPETALRRGGDKWWVEQRLHYLKDNQPIWRAKALRAEYV